MYIQVDVSLPEHPKLKKLARTLGVTRPTAMGHLNALWCWAATYAPDGDLTAYLNDADAIADAAMWDGDATAFVTALLDAHFGDESAGFLEVTVDGAMIIHDWQDYFGRVLEKRQANAERMRDARRASRHDGNTPPTRAPVTDETCNARATHADSTCAPNVNVTKRNENVNVTESNDNDNAEATGDAQQEPDPAIAAAAVVYDLSPQQLTALSFLLTAVPHFGDPVNFVRRHNPKLIAYWSLYVTSQPPERLQSIDNLGGLISAYVKAGNAPQLKPDVRRQYDEMVDRFLYNQDDPDIAEFLATLSGLSDT